MLLELIIILFNISSLSLSLRQVASAKQRFLSHRLFVENLLSGFELCIPIIIILTYQYTKSDICFSFSKNSSAKNMSQCTWWAASSQSFITQCACDVLGFSIPSLNTNKFKIIPNQRFCLFCTFSIFRLLNLRNPTILHQSHHQKTKFTILYVKLIAKLKQCTYTFVFLKS